MNPQVIKEIRDAIYGDAYTAIHAVVIFEDGDRIKKFSDIWRIVTATATRLYELDELCVFFENEMAKRQAEDADND